MVLLIIQVTVLLILAVAVGTSIVYFPYPSPFVRRWLPPRDRWPERQIRGWLKTGRFDRGFIRYFYRDPERVVPPGDDVLAPADGLVTSTDVRDGIRYLVIALSFWDMHVQTSPLAGRVVKVTMYGEDFMDGEGREFAFLREKPCPVQKRIVLATSLGEVAVRLITSVAARRIETWVNEEDRVDRGQRIGRILLGSTVVLELPEATTLRIKVGDRVRALETVVAGVGYAS